MRCRRYYVMLDWMEEWCDKWEMFWDEYFRGIMEG
jgi:hypothetical protein